MALNPAVWRPIAIGVAALNLIAAGFALGENAWLHAGVHGALAIAFGWWTARLGREPRAMAPPSELENLEAQLTSLRRELADTQERLDFTERVLAQRSEPRRS